MKLNWKRTNQMDEAKAFISHDYLYVRRGADGKWTCFSVNAGWQQADDYTTEIHFKRADVVFYKGDKLELEF